MNTDYKNYQITIIAPPEFKWTPDFEFHNMYPTLRAAKIGFSSRFGYLDDPGTRWEIRYAYGDRLLSSKVVPGKWRDE